MSFGQTNGTFHMNGNKDDNSTAYNNIKTNGSIY